MIGEKIEEDEKKMKLNLKVVALTMKHLFLQKVMARTMKSLLLSQIIQIIHSLRPKMDILTVTMKMREIMTRIKIMVTLGKKMMR
jgi:hypothetical protein